MRTNPITIDHLIHKSIYNYNGKYGKQKRNATGTYPPNHLTEYGSLLIAKQFGHALKKLAYTLTKDCQPQFE